MPASARRSLAPVRSGPTSSAMIACNCSIIAAVFGASPSAASAATRSSAARRSAACGFAAALAASTRGSASPGAAAEHQCFGDAHCRTADSRHWRRRPLRRRQTGRGHSWPCSAPPRQRRPCDNARSARPRPALCVRSMPFAASRSITGPKASRSAAAVQCWKDEIGPAMRRAAAGLDFLDDGVGREIARQHIFAVLVRAVFRRELFHLAVKQPAAKLVAERIPHDRVHADEPRRQMPDRKELDEFHVDQRRAGAQRQRIAVAAHIGGGAVAAVKPCQPAGRQHGRLGRNRRPARRCRDDSPPRR